jgi:geranylgeranyl diphosphate synthase type II
VDLRRVRAVAGGAGRGKLTYPGILGVTESRHRTERLCRQAQDHLAGLGQAGARLAALARSIVTRDR